MIVRLSRLGFVVGIVLGVTQPGATTSLQADTRGQPAAASLGRLGDPGPQRQLASSMDRLAQLDAARAPLETLDAEVSQLDRQMAQLSAQVEQARDRLEVAEVDRTRLAAALADTEQQIARLRRQIAEQAIAAYIAPRSDAIEVFASSADLDSSVRRYGLVRSVIEAGERAADRLQVARADLLALQAALEQADRAAGELQQLVGTGQAQLDAAGTTRAEIAAGLASRVEALDQEALGQQRGQAELLRILSRAELEAEEAADTTLSSPIDATITSEFGPRWGRQHSGVDFESYVGAPIHAARPGVVIEADWLDGYGNVTVIDHGGGVTTLYAHQSEQAVHEGEQVERGQLIGSVGVTGNSTGPHLHFEVHVDGAAVDPREYLS